MGSPTDADDDTQQDDDKMDENESPGSPRFQDFDGETEGQVTEIPVIEVKS